jgi:hypothetical protein
MHSIDNMFDENTKQKISSYIIRTSPYKPFKSTFVESKDDPIVRL